MAPSTRARCFRRSVCEIMEREASGWGSPAARPGRRRCSKPDQAAGPRSGPRSPGTTRRGMGDRHQSAAARHDGAVFADRAGSGEVISAMRKLIVACLRLYQLVVSPLLPSACRYYPTCRSIPARRWKSMDRSAACGWAQNGSCAAIPFTPEVSILSGRRRHVIS